MATGTGMAALLLAAWVGNSFSLLLPPVRLWNPNLVVCRGTRYVPRMMIDDGRSSPQQRPTPLLKPGTPLTGSNGTMTLPPAVALPEQLLSENQLLRARVAELESAAQKWRTTPGVLDDVEDSDWCDVLDSESCETESVGEFLTALRSRAIWLVGLLAFQSCSSFILAGNEALIQRHPAIVYFLTMLVGAGGNAGNQAAVRIIRGLATGSITETTQWQFLTREFKMAVAISVLVTLVGFARVAFFGTSFADTVAISLALWLIVFISVVTGAALPLLLDSLSFDAAHASTTIQVVMDISGVLIVCAVSTLLLEGDLNWLTTMLPWW